jgi:hypothetical protein
MILKTFEPRHDKTNIMGLRPAWIQTSMRIRAVWAGSMLFAISFSTCNIEYVSEQHASWSDCADAQAGPDPCWPQTHYVGFVVMQLISWYTLYLGGKSIWWDFLDNYPVITYFSTTDQLLIPLIWISGKRQMTIRLNAPDQMSWESCGSPMDWTNHSLITKMMLSLLS